MGFQVYLGDAWSEQVSVQVIPLPIVELSVAVRAPAYVTAGGEGEETVADARQVAVIEGSQVAINLKSSKPLKSATLKTDGATLSFQRRASVADSPGDEWILADAPALARVTETIPYEIQVVDTDGLSLERPITGVIRLKADRPPKVYADITTRHVLPTAHPSIWYGASDDFGLAQLKVSASVQRGADSKEETRSFPLPVNGHPRRITPLLFHAPANEAAALDKQTLTPELRQAFAEQQISLPQGAGVTALEPGSRWSISAGSPSERFIARREGGRVNVFREFLLDLSQFELRIGDKIRIELQAVDYRGPAPGKAAASEPIELHVTNERGVFAAMVETDQRSAEQLNAIIQRQLGIGESP